MMPRTMQVYLALGPVDLRGAFDRLAALTRQVLSLDPTSGALFLFVNRRRNRLKALWWDHNGYTLLYKRLARGSFAVPEGASSDCACLEISSEDLRRLLAGLSIDATTPPHIIQ